MDIEFAALISSISEDFFTSRSSIIVCLVCKIILSHKERLKGGKLTKDSLGPMELNHFEVLSY